MVSIHLSNHNQWILLIYLGLSCHLAFSFHMYSIMNIHYSRNNLDESYCEKDRDYGNHHTVIIWWDVFKVCFRSCEQFSNLTLFLVNTDRPKNVFVLSADGKDGPNVREKEDLVLKCTAESNPPVTSYTWRKTAARTEELKGQNDILTLRSVTPSHSGLYSCTAHNDLGTGESQEFEVKVMCK